MSKLSEFLTRAKGKVARPWADAAGDRHSEANAAIEAETGHKPDDQLLDAVEHEVRRRHGDIDEPPT
ncbi:MAG: hypothetical protein JWM72_3473 [Actinomycetia bacterium]|jgi:hypothetical protein|nr:hypothetical protein [Actinomycetes bacterium]MDQ1461838.1 hypothetical protein [Actinomycetota bacterium]